MLTIAGAVKSPVTLRVPIGTTYRDVLEAAGGLTTDDPVLVIGGLMMGQHTDDLDTPITKTATGVVILPRDHHVMERKLKPNKVQAKIGKSACDQCRYCTEYCPRFLLGYAVEPHQVMRSLAFTATGADYWNQWAAMCCSCGLCTLYACPEELFPKEACDDSKAEMRRQQMKWTGPTDRQSRTRCATAATCPSRRSRANCTCENTTCPRRFTRRKSNRTVLCCRSNKAPAPRAWRK